MPGLIAWHGFLGCSTMYASHSDFEAPDEGAVLWKYFDLSRYLDLLIREQLFFSCVDRLEDPFEGKAKKGNDITISAWHSNPEENYAMWKIYAQGMAGLAIQTTYRQLKESFRRTDKPIWIGKVHYCEDGSLDAAAEGSLRPYMEKRLIYAFEREVRCCYEPAGGDGNQRWEEQDEMSGAYIPVDLATLIAHVYINPYAPKWLHELVVGVNKRFGIEKEAIHSDIFGNQRRPKA